MAGLGTDHAGQPGRRGSRDSGQTANMVLLVVQIETGPPEQRVRRALQCADHRARCGDVQSTIDGCPAPTASLPHSLPPARRIVRSESRGHRTVIQAPSVPNWQGPICAGRPAVIPSPFQAGWFRYETGSCPRHAALSRATTRPNRQSSRAAMPSPRTTPRSWLGTDQRRR